MPNLVEALKAEADRVGKLRETYLELGPPGRMAADIMKVDIDAVFDAVVEGDTQKMLALLESLKNWKE